MGKASPLSPLVEPLRELVRDLDRHLSHVGESTGATLACFSCDFLPFEILSACGIYPFVPSAGTLPSSLDIIVSPENCCRFVGRAGSVPAVTVSSLPAGYGETVLPQWEKVLDDAVARISGVQALKPDRELLAECTEKYNAVRRMVRGIASIRREKNSLLTNRDLHAVFDAALCLPHDTIRPHLVALMEALNGTNDNGGRQGIPAMVYFSFNCSPTLLDELETAGFLAVEDDACSGRRSFDLSHDASSPDLYREILNAFSFRPFCPCLRGAGERFELLYRLAASYGIETVILVEDNSCPRRAEQIGWMKMRLMRAGLDPLVVTPEDAVESARRYIGLASL